MRKNYLKMKFYSSNKALKIYVVFVMKIKMRFNLNAIIFFVINVFFNTFHRQYPSLKHKLNAQIKIVSLK